MRREIDVSGVSVMLEHVATIDTGKLEGSVDTSPASIWEMSPS